ncbi:diguanylate phosphodiesterase [Sporosarcina sp. P26b]|uniref:EAL domain-containing protein n=1 Tax=unclassified Sporosarcina TaxID=2647733 RepID=UPI000C165595|nr:MULTISPECIES: EAL domain-containing protein [unclassified Sporosarcina]PIC72843.1 diguanylate phosphodiesterase [Sporosarcina sp. P17b]PIC96727.1 diguanylate phosphodiesterase [Sporosarcina sp. P26b]
MPCKGCIVRDIDYEVSFEKCQQPALIVSIEEHLKRAHMLVRQEDQTFHVKEQGIKELYDFCVDHAVEMDSIQFRLDQTDWRPFTEVMQVVEMQWIDQVIKDEQLTSHYQPIVTPDLEIYAYELLARFYHKDGRVIYPNEIFTAAKERGRLYALDRVCRLTAVRYAKRITQKAFINFIPTSIYSPEFCLRSTIKLANDLEIDPYRLIFEVVESEKVEDMDHLKTILEYYHSRGFEYALDDVGEGYNTVEVLSFLRPNYMKLDIKYVQGVATDPAKQVIAAKFLEKALAVDAIPLAEGIEEVEDFEWLKAKGYQLFQGYLFGKPSAVPLAEILI